MSLNMQLVFQLFTASYYFYAVFNQWPFCKSVGAEPILSGAPDQHKNCSLFDASFFCLEFR